MVRISVKYILLMIIGTRVSNRLRSKQFFLSTRWWRVRLCHRCEHSEWKIYDAKGYKPVSKHWTSAFYLSLAILHFSSEWYGSVRLRRDNDSRHTPPHNIGKHTGLQHPSIHREAFRVVSSSEPSLSKFREESSPEHSLTEFRRARGTIATPFDPTTTNQGQLPLYGLGRTYNKAYYLSSAAQLREDTLH